MIDDDEAYERFRVRDTSLDGHLWMGVMTTGIYCRPVCPARGPLRKNVRFFETRESARAAGLRACKRCRPDQ
jgi:methylphosphotriester-DNA--protein-cysteine methyltransferase